jgi:integrase
MMKRPWYWKARKGWYVSRGGSQVRLGETEDEALRAWGEILIADSVGTPTAIVAGVAELYLQHAKRNVEPSTYDGYARYLADFCGAHGNDQVRNLKPFHLTAWLDKHKGWGDASRRLAISAVKRCFAWAVVEGLVSANPFASVKRPAIKRRETLVSDDQHAAMMQRCERHFRPLLIMLKQTGMRPGSVCNLTAESVSADGAAVVLHDHKTRKKTGKPQVVYLSPCAATLVRIAMARAREGKSLFTNRFDKPWTGNAIRCRMRRLRENLGLPAGTVAYSYRHAWATRAIANGVDIATAAELLGHTDTKMISQVYGHLAAMQEHLKEAARKAVS